MKIQKYKKYSFSSLSFRFPFLFDYGWHSLFVPLINYFIAITSEVDRVAKRAEYISKFLTDCLE